VTLNPDGSPQVTVVWVGLDGDEIVAAHLPEHRKVCNILTPPPGYITHIKVNRVSGVGPWATGH